MRSYHIGPSPTDETCGRKMLYKVVRRLDNGKLVSQYISIGYSIRNKMLSYQSRKITNAPKGTNGIFCYTTLKAACWGICENTYSNFTGIVEIHECEPIGELIPNGCAFARCYPSIKLGKCIRKIKVINGFNSRYSNKYIYWE